MRARRLLGTVLAIAALGTTGPLAAGQSASAAPAAPAGIHTRLTYSELAARLKADGHPAAAGHKTMLASSVPCLLGVPIRAEYNNSYVSAEFGWTGNAKGILRARTPATAVPGDWERFDICDNGGGLWTIYSPWGSRFVAAEHGWTGDQKSTLRARTAAVLGPWEKFYLTSLNNSTSAVVLQSASESQLVVSAEMGRSGNQKGELRARTYGLFGPWERLYLY